MAIKIFFGMGVIMPPSEPTCCPDSYLCLTGTPEIECPRHGGFDVCCDNPGGHITQPREVWNEAMWHWEQELLNAHIKKHVAEEQETKAEQERVDMLSLATPGPMAIAN